MKNLLITCFLFFLITAISAQEATFYTNDKGDTHLCGPFDMEVLTTNETYKDWYNENYQKFELSSKNSAWSKNLTNLKVDIYLGTWCGDSKKWVPQFVNLWQSLGLPAEQLNFIALYDMGYEEKYKQGPNREEKGKMIHRVPTFIFKKDNEEVARIVESPVTDMETDLAQIALGYPTTPNYKGANYMMKLIKNTPMPDILENISEHLNKVYRMVVGSKELNTLGYVYLKSDMVDEALLAFYFNTLYYKYNPNVYDSYAEALAITGDTENAIKNYEIVLKLDPENENAKAQLDKLKE